MGGGKSRPTGSSGIGSAPHLYLSQLIFDAKTDAERKRIIDIIKNGSIVTWQHINMQGEYNFSDEYLKEALEFYIDNLIALQIA